MTPAPPRFHSSGYVDPIDNFLPESHGTAQPIYVRTTPPQLADTSSVRFYTLPRQGEAGASRNSERSRDPRADRHTAMLPGMSDAERHLVSEPTRSSGTIREAPTPCRRCGRAHVSRPHDLSQNVRQPILSSDIFEPSREFQAPLRGEDLYAAIEAEYQRINQEHDRTGLSRWKCAVCDMYHAHTIRRLEQEGAERLEHLRARVLDADYSDSESESGFEFEEPQSSAESGESVDDSSKAHEKTDLEDEAWDPAYWAAVLEEQERRLTAFNWIRKNYLAQLKEYVGRNHHIIEKLRLRRRARKLQALFDELVAQGRPGTEEFLAGKSAYVEKAFAWFEKHHGRKAKDAEEVRMALREKGKWRKAKCLEDIVSGQKRRARKHKAAQES